MIRPLALSMASLAIVFTAAARCEETDGTERSVLGGSPPIYVSQPQTPQVTSDYKRYRAIPHDAAPSPDPSRTGVRCATRAGLFGPGAPSPVNATCIGRAPDGRLYRGRVVPDGHGRFCVTATGIFGPGAEQPIGMPCRGETKNGPVQGRIAGVD